MHKYLKSTRSNSGSAISEMPPAMFLLVFFALLPIINLIFFGVVFASCIALNDIELREAARTPYTQLSDVLSGLQNSWQTNGLGQLAGVTKAPESNVSYTNIGADAYVAVSTTFTVKPLISVPFFNKVPGLGAPWSFSVNGKRVLENPNYANL